MKTVAPNSPSEIANAKPAATSSGAGDDRQVDLAPHPRWRRAERRRGLAQARVDGAQHRRHDAHDERDRDERLRDRDRATTSRGGRAAAWSSAMRKPKPTVTADTPSGSDDGACRAPRLRRRASANAAAPADDHREHGGDRREPQRVGDRVDRRDEQRAARVQRRRGRGRSRGRSRRAGAATARRGPAAGTPSSEGHQREVGPDEDAGARRCAGGGRSRAPSAAAARRCARPSIQPGHQEQHHDGDELHEGERGGERRGSAAGRSGGRSRSRAWRIAGRPG